MTFENVVANTFEHEKAVVVVDVVVLKIFELALTDLSVLKVVDVAQVVTVVAAAFVAAAVFVFLKVLELAQTDLGVLKVVDVVTVVTVVAFDAVFVFLKIVVEVTVVTVVAATVAASAVEQARVNLGSGVRRQQGSSCHSACCRC
jgi:hypothetical protein